MSDVKLERVHQIFIVQQLAMFERGVNIQKALKDEFEIEISRAGISYYNISNPDLPKEFKKLFTKIRNDFLKNSAKIPIANKSYRLQKLYKLYEAEEDKHPAIQSPKTMRALLEQAAKESGDAYSNKQKVELTGRNGEPIKSETTAMTFDEWNRHAEERLRQASETLENFEG